MAMTPPSRPGCAVRVGFFTLRDCAQAVTGRCASCARTACADHLVSDGRCVECAARDAEGDEEDELWAWYARSEAVQHHGLRPFYDGTDPSGTYYDDWDLRPMQAAGPVGPLGLVAALGADEDDDLFDS